MNQFLLLWETVIVNNTQIKPLQIKAKTSCVNFKWFLFPGKLKPQEVIYLEECVALEDSFRAECSLASAGWSLLKQRRNAFKSTTGTGLSAFTDLRYKSTSYYRWIPSRLSGDRYALCKSHGWRHKLQSGHSTVHLAHRAGWAEIPAVFWMYLVIVSFWLTLPIKPGQS